MGRLFGTDGVRGSANKDLTPELVFSLGKSASLVIAQRHGKGKAKAVVGRDPRASGEMLEAALIAGHETSHGRQANAHGEHNGMNQLNVDAQRLGHVAVESTRANFHAQPGFADQQVQASRQQLYRRYALDAGLLQVRVASQGKVVRVDAVSAR